MNITLPIRSSDYEEDYEFYELFLEEIVRLSNNPLLIKFLDNENNPQINERSLISNLTFKIEEGNRYDNNTEPKFATDLNKKHSFFHTEFTSEYLIITILFKEHKAINENDEDGYAISLINDYLTRLHFLINLTYHTNIDFLHGVVYSNSELFLGKTEIITAENMMYVYKHAREMDWPKIKNLSLIQTLEWFDKFNIHPNNKSQNSLHRAINSFSHLFGDIRRDDSAHLFWIMLGIEALLVEGNQNITSQFKEKSILIFGKPKEYSKKLAKLYDYRSKLVHGGFDIYPRFYLDYNAHHKEYHDFLSFAPRCAKSPDFEHHTIK